MRKLAMLLMLVAATLPRAQAQPNGVTADLQLDQSQYLPDEDVHLSVRIFNRSGQPIVLGDDDQWITFEVLGERDYVAPKLAEMPVKGQFTLLSGQTVTKEFNPAPYFGFRRPGRYSIAAIIKLPQWKQEIVCKPIGFMISEGFPLTSLGNLSFGVPPPPGVTNVPPEVRRYSLVKVTTIDQMKLYFRLTDSVGRTLRVLPLARTVSFGDPEAQLDRANNFHVLFQSGARNFDYFAINPNGSVLLHQSYEYTLSRPKLRLSEDGWIFVAGGQRIPSEDDIPAPAQGTAKNP